MSKTIIVSNRLPISLRHRNGRFEFKPSAGGLATGLDSIYKAGENIWIGWPGNTVEDHEQRAEIILELNDLHQYHSHPPKLHHFVLLKIFSLHLYI